MFKGYESDHNKAYWNGYQYIGIGPGIDHNFSFNILFLNASPNILCRSLFGFVAETFLSFEVKAKLKLQKWLNAN